MLTLTKPMIANAWTALYQSDMIDIHEIISQEVYLKILVLFIISRGEFFFLHCVKDFLVPGLLGINMDRYYLESGTFLVLLFLFVIDEQC